MVLIRIINRSGILQHRVRSGVLQLTLGISLIISILCGSAILLVYYSKLEFINHEVSNKLRANAASGIEYLLAESSALAFNEHVALGLFDDDQDSVQIVLKPWGIFEVGVAMAWQGNRQHIKTALIAGVPDEIGRPRSTRLTIMLRFIWLERQKSQEPFMLPRENSQRATLMAGALKVINW